MSAYKYKAFRMSVSPKISVITVTYNDAESLLKTMESVRSQSYPNIEYIVIDGGSSDSTLSYIKSFEDVISCFVSEADEGIYDAMNKGSKLAAGEYITFLNAGDYYYSDDCLERIFTEAEICSYDVIYGSNYYYKNRKMILQEPRPLELFYRGMPFNHQSVFVRSDLVKGSPFKHNVYRIQCEYQFLLDLYLRDCDFYKVDTIVAVYEAGGFSDVNFLERTLERWLIVKRAGICDETADQHYYSLVSGCFVDEDQVAEIGKVTFIEKVKNKIRSRLLR